MVGELRRVLHAANDPVSPWTDAVYVSLSPATFVTVRCSVSEPAIAPIPIDGRFSSFARIVRAGHELETDGPVTPQMKPRYFANPPDL